MLDQGVPRAVKDFHALTDAHLQRVLALLSAKEPSPPSPAGSTEHAQAAVSLVLRTTADLELMLIKRAVSELDPWSGHMALPGGRRDPTDGDLEHTAVRETAEETGVELGSHGWRLGRLEELTPSTNRLPLLTIAPYVFGVPDHTTASANSHEVESVMWVSIDTLRDPGTRGATTIDLADGRRVFPCFRVEGHAVWGLTFRILTDFLETVEEL